MRVYTREFPVRIRRCANRDVQALNCFSAAGEVIDSLGHRLSSTNFIAALN